MIIFIDPYRITLINVSLVILVTVCLLFYRFRYPKKNISLLVLLIIISIIPTISPLDQALLMQEIYGHIPRR